MTIRKIPEDFLSKILAQEELGHSRDKKVIALITYIPEGDENPGYYIITPDLNGRAEHTMGDEIREDLYNLD